MMLPGPAFFSRLTRMISLPHRSPTWVIVAMTRLDRDPAKPPFLLTRTSRTTTPPDLPFCVPRRLREGADERLLHGVLSFSLISGHGVELADQAGECRGVEAGERRRRHVRCGRHLMYRRQAYLVAPENGINRLMGSPRRHDI